MAWSDLYFVVMNAFALQSLTMYVNSWLVSREEHAVYTRPA
uniref:Unannotated protein n=1 Tax=freshwater metagenome TaxID=449393 RepID=A0A6J7NF54_9ZZZZ